jgi:hypothetical protein
VYGVVIHSLPTLPLLESRDIQEGHQYDPKTSDTSCHVNLPIPG